MSPLVIGKKTLNTRTLLKAGALVLLLSTLLWDPLLNNPAEESLRWISKHYPVLLTPPQLQAMYKSLIEGYWVPQTGVFLSFPRTSDARLIQQASTYDQGVSGLLLLKLGDKEKVQQILKFYETAWDAESRRSGPRQGRKGLSNFYNAYYRVEGVEKTMHVGPNAWIGLLAARYHRQTADPAAFKLALEIEGWIVHQVPHMNGVVAMGEIPWNSAPWDKIFSTENNLSTYAFLNDLLKCTDLTASDRQEVLDEKNRIGDWLVHHAYDVKTGKVLRGFHWQGPDVIGAIDSYSWYLSALRPDYLYAQGVPTDHLLHVATHEFVVRVGGLRGVDAVDQGMASATYRDDVFVRKTKDRLFLRPAKDHHRLLWYEGQGQYIVTLQDMARDAAMRAFSRPEPERQRLLAESVRWLQLAQNLTQWMDRASFDLPFGPVYPCASPGRFYLWGWPAPAPMKDHPADAIAPLAWRMLSGMGYEPLSDTQINPSFNSVVQIDSLSFRNPGTDLLYGASEEMVVRAWQLYEGKHYSHAQRQARVTIALWEKDAKKLEKLKEKEVGTFLPYEQGNMTQFQRIHDYWALNDVAAAYFIIGKIADERKDYTKALQAFSILLKNYHLAQMWDKRGWFWDPVETLQMDYASADEKHYGALMNILYPEKRHWYSSIFHRAST